MSSTIPFKELGLAPALLSALTELGYESPTPVQQQSIPVLLEGRDILSQAQTGTGKTAAFALPILSNLDLSLKAPQALVIAPTRELAIQVAEAFQSYAKHLPDFHVTPIYGGQDYRTQLRSLKRGPHVIVGTPGRVMDHIRRGTLLMGSLKTVVLDEGDEMLNMGFIDDIEWILEQIKHQHQTALFSATMPPSIVKIANRYLKNAKHINVKPTKRTVDGIEQCFICVDNKQKLELLTRFLEVEEINASIVFTRTKHASEELAQKLQARGYAVSALNGDMNQAAREKVISRIKNGALDIVVATDVAARGLDVSRVSHVINYDIPCDIESYIHRIGRTGRAGREGKAILFVTPRERRLLNDIERSMPNSIKLIEPPSLQQMTDKRVRDLTGKISSIVANSKKLGPYYKMVTNMVETTDLCAEDVCAALAHLMQQGNPLPSYEIQPAMLEAPQQRRRSSDRNRRSARAYHDSRGFRQRNGRQKQQ